MTDSTQHTAGHTTADACTDNDAVALIGYPPENDCPGVRRLYEGPGSPTHVEIKVADIVDPPAGEDKRPREPGQVVLWVRRDARVVLCEVPVYNVGQPGDPGHEGGLPQWPRG